MMLAGMSLATVFAVPLARYFFELPLPFQEWMGNPDSQYANGIRLVQFFAAFLSFFLPALLLKFFANIDLSLKTSANWKIYALASMVMLFSMPVVTQLAEWSASLPIPGAIGEALKAQQEANDNLLEQLLVMPNAWLFLGNFLVLALLPALAEELLFRGVMLKLLLSRLSMGMSVLLNAALFSVVHQQVFNFVGIFALGAFLAWMYAKTMDFKLVVWLHLLNNGLLLLLIYLGLEQQVLEQSVLICLPIVLLALFGLKRSV